MANVEKKLVQYENGYLVKKSIKQTLHRNKLGIIQSTTAGNHTRSVSVTTGTLQNSALVTSIARGANFVILPKFKFWAKAGGVPIGTAKRRAKLYFAVWSGYGNPNATSSVIASGQTTITFTTGTDLNSYSVFLTAKKGGVRSFIAPTRKNIRIGTSMKLTLSRGASGYMSAYCKLTGANRLQFNALRTSMI